MKTLLAISPHLDDAIFSAGALLARKARQGWRVVIATCFTASVADPKGFALDCQLDKGIPATVDYMALRRAEDRAACALIGADPIHLPFVEAPHRGYESAAALFGQARGGDDVVGPLRSTLAALHASIAPDMLLAPACIGNHVDHWAVRRALPGPALLWSDLPYAAKARHCGSKTSHAIPCAEEFDLKVSASLLYRSQTCFQLGCDLDTSLLSLAGHEGFETSARRMASHWHLDSGSGLTAATRRTAELQCTTRECE